MFSPNVVRVRGNLSENFVGLLDEDITVTRQCLETQKLFKEKFMKGNESNCNIPEPLWNGNLVHKLKASDNSAHCKVVLLENII